jgi:hypothetical protein
MAQVRNISGRSLNVPELGFGYSKIVTADEVVEVPDDRFAGYVGPAGFPSELWAAVSAPAAGVFDGDQAPVVATAEQLSEQYMAASGLTADGTAVAEPDAPADPAPASVVAPPAPADPPPIVPDPAPAAPIQNEAV